MCKCSKYNESVTLCSWSNEEIFIELARSVYITNDERMNIKNIINQNSNSDIKEHKSYKPYI